MVWQRVLFWSLFLLMAAMALNYLIGHQVSPEPGMTVWVDRLRNGGAILLGIAALMWLLEKLGVRVSGARCADCKKTIQHGQTYCRDDFKRRLEEGRERLHQHRGSGV